MKNQYQLSDEEDPQLQTNLTPGTSQQIAPVQAPPPTMAPPPMAPVAKPQAMPNLAPLAQGAVSPTKLPGMPPSVTPDDIMPYLNAQKSQLNKYGPDQRMALQNSLNDRQNSLGYKLTDAGKGFADALMMGVARAGNPGWQNQFEGQEQQNAQNQIGALKDASEMSTKKVESNMSLDKMNPNSALSKDAQAQYAPVFQELGFSPEKIKGMSATNVETTLSLLSQFEPKKLEAAMKAMELGVENKKLGATLSNIESESENRKQQRNIEERKVGLEDIKTQMEHPIMSLFNRSSTPIEEITPDVTAYAQKHGISPEQALQIKKQRGG